MWHWSAHQVKLQTKAVRGIWHPKPQWKTCFFFLNLLVFDHLLNIPFQMVSLQPKMERRHNVCILQAGGDGFADNGFQTVRFIRFIWWTVSQSHIWSWSETAHLALLSQPQRDDNLQQKGWRTSCVCIHKCSPKDGYTQHQRKEADSFLVALICPNHHYDNPRYCILFWCVTTLFLGCSTSLSVLFSLSGKDRNFKTF